MKYGYRVIADEDTVLGFRSAGVAGETVGTSEEVVQALTRAKEQRVGIIIMTEEVADMARREVDALHFGETPPMVVEIPGPQGAMEGRRSLTDIIREAIGIRV